jgi:hypothetical protein
VSLELPADELAELAEILDSEQLHVLRDRYARPREVRQPLLRFTDRVWLFPFGVTPDIRQPVQVYVNGLLAWMGREVELVRVGRVHPVVVAVMGRPLHLGDVVAAVYVVVPQEAP